MYKDHDRKKKPACCQQVNSQSQACVGGWHPDSMTQNGGASALSPWSGREYDRIHIEIEAEEGSNAQGQGQIVLSENNYYYPYDSSAAPAAPTA